MIKYIYTSLLDVNEIIPFEDRKLQMNRERVEERWSTDEWYTKEHLRHLTIVLPILQLQTKLNMSM